MSEVLLLACLQAYCEERKELGRRGGTRGRTEIPSSSLKFSEEIEPLQQNRDWGHHSHC